VPSTLQADVVTFSSVSKVLEDVGDVPPSEPVLLSRAADDKAGLCVRLAGTDGDFGPALALAELEEHRVRKSSLLWSSASFSSLPVWSGVKC
jgi:hypothetical protein